MISGVGQRSQDDKRHEGEEQTVARRLPGFKILDAQLVTALRLAALFLPLLLIQIDRLLLVEADLSGECADEGAVENTAG